MFLWLCFNKHLQWDTFRHHPKFISNKHQGGNAESIEWLHHSAHNLPHGGPSVEF
jgi:hypothetical protein